MSSLLGELKMLLRFSVEFLYRVSVKVRALIKHNFLCTAPRRRRRQSVAPIFSISPFEQRVFAGSMLSPGAEVANPSIGVGAATAEFDSSRKLRDAAAAAVRARDAASSTRVPTGTSSAPAPGGSGGIRTVSDDVLEIQRAAFPDLSRLQTRGASLAFGNSTSSLSGQFSSTPLESTSTQAQGTDAASETVESAHAAAAMSGSRGSSIPKSGAGGGSAGENGEDEGSGGEIQTASAGPSVVTTPPPEYLYTTNPHRLRFQFDQDVSNSLSTADNFLTNLTTNTQIAPSALALSYENATNTAEFRPNNPAGQTNTFATGNYESVLVADGITNAIGTPMADDFSFPFYFFVPDIDRNRTVDIADFGLMAPNFNAPGDYTKGDLNFDGIVNINDFSLMAPAFNTSLPEPPTEPNTLTSTAALGPRRIDLNWMPPAGPVDGFRVYQSEDGVEFTQIQQIADPDARSYTIQNLQEGKKYTHRVRAYTVAAGNSETTNKAVATTSLPAPTEFKAKDVTQTSLTLQWKDNAEHETNYEVWQQVAFGAWTKTTIAPNSGVGGTMTFPVTGLVPRTPYAFRVRAITPDQQSMYTQTYQKPLDTIHIDGTGGLTGWTVDESGGTVAGKGTATAANDGITLHEGDSFILAIEREITIPPSPATLSFEYSNLSLDTDGDTTIRDAFEVALVDEDGNSLVETIVGSRDSFLNITAGLPPAMGSGTTLSNSTFASGAVDLNISNLTPGSTARFVMRLVNNDGTVESGPESIVTLVGDGLVPKPQIDGPSSIDEGGTYTLSLAAPPETDEWQINWGDGSPLATVAAGDRWTTHTFGDGDTTNTISAQAIVDGTPQNADPIIVSVQNVAPALTVTGDPTTTVGASYELDRVAVDPGADTISQWQVDWGDSGGTFAPYTPHTYTAPGTYTIATKAVDEDGEWFAQPRTVTVLSNSTGINIGGASSVAEGSTYTLSIGTNAPSGTNFGSLNVNWGDGHSNTLAVGAVSATHVYGDNSTSRSIVVSGSAGGTAYQSNTLNVVVNNVKPTVTGLDQYVTFTTTPLPPVTLDVATFTDPGFSDTNAGTSETYTATIDWGDGSALDTNVTFTNLVNGAPGVLSSGGVRGTHTYSVGGVYQGTVSIKDDDSGAVAATAVFTVQVEDEEIHHCIFQVPGTPGTNTTMRFNWNFRSAGFNNELGVFIVDDVSGKIGAKRPSDANVATNGYWKDALTRLVDVDHDGSVDDPGHHVIFANNQTAGAQTFLTLPAGTLFTTYLVANNTTAAAIAQSGTALPTSPKVWFCFEPLNGDGITHMQRNDLSDGRVQYEVEDLDHNDPTYDDDYDDMVYTITLGAPPSYAGAKKFFVVDKDTFDVNNNSSSILHYDDGGAFDGRWGVAVTNVPSGQTTNPRGIVANSAGTRLWHVDASNRHVYLVNNSGAKLGRFQANSVTGTLEGIATEGTNIFLLDNLASGTDVVRKYNNRAADNQYNNNTNAPSYNQNSSFNLNSANSNATDIVTDNGTFFWVVNDAPSGEADKVFKYNATGTLQGSWSLDPANTDPSGITLTPGASGTQLWVLDRVDKKVYRYDSGRTQLSGSATANGTFQLATVNSNPEGIADPPPASTTTRGKDFWIAFPTNGAPAEPNLDLFVTSELGSNVRVTQGAFNFDFTLTINAGSAGRVPLDMYGQGEGAGMGFHLEVLSGDDVSVYAMSRAPASSDGYLALPTATLGNEYVVLSYPRTVPSSDSSQFAVVATTPGITNVTITPSTVLYDGTGVHPAGVEFTKTLNQGDVYIGQNWDYGFDISGTEIVSDNPIGVFAGNRITQIPDSIEAADFIVEQMTPVDNWGTDFLAVPLATRTGNDTFRFVASDDVATPVYVNGILLTTLNSSGVGRVFESRAISGNAWITSTRHIAVAQYSNSATYDGVLGADPFMMLLTPTSQLGQSTLFSPPSYPEFNGTIDYSNFVNVIVPTSAQNSLLVDGAAPQATFAPVGASGYVGASIPIANGAHSITASLPIAAYVYGFGSAFTIPFDSYGFPASRYNLTTVSAIDLRPARALVEVGSTINLTASVLGQGGLPVSGIEVALKVNGQVIGTDVTDASGLASFGYSSGVAGVDTVVAEVASQSDSSKVTWVAASAPWIQVSSPSNDDRFGVGAMPLASGTAAAGSAYAPIISVTVNGVVVDQLDRTGNFFTKLPPLLAGTNGYTFVATDALGRTASTALVLEGVSSEVNQNQLLEGYQGRYGRTSFDDGTNTLWSELSIENTGDADIRAPLWVGISNLSNPTIDVANADGLTESGIAYFDFSQELGDGVLTAAELSQYITVGFHNPNRIHFSYDLVLLSQPNRTPAFATVPLTQVNAGRNYSYDADATDADGDSITYQIVTGPLSGAGSADDLKVNAQTGVVTWTARSPEDIGSHTVVVRASDSFGGFSDQTFTLEVHPASYNRPPYFTSSPPVISRVNQPYSYQVTAVDPNGDPVTAIELVQPSPAFLNMTFDNGLLSWTPTTAQLAPTAIKIRVTAGGESVEQSFVIQVLPDPAKHAPVIVTSPKPESFRAGDSFAYDVDAFDPDNDIVSYAASGLPSGLSMVNSTGVISGTLNSVGVFTVSVTVTDQAGYTDTQLFNLQVQSSGNHSISGVVYNDADRDGLRSASETGVSGRRVFLDQNQNRRFDAGERFTDSLANGSYSFSGLVPGEYALGLVGATGQSATAPATGSHVITLTAISSTLENVDFGTAAIGGSNGAPAFRTAPADTARSGDLYIYRAFALDPDGDSVTYALNGAPDGMVLDPATGVVGWRPRYDQIGGPYTVELDANDGNGHTVIQAFAISVTAGDPPIVTQNRPPAFTSLPPTTGLVDELYAYAIAASDPDQDTLTYTILSGPDGLEFVNGGVTVVGGPAVIQWMPTNPVPEPVEIEIQDGYGGRVTQLFNIDVAGDPSDHAPIITSHPPLVARANLPAYPYVYDVNAYDPDPQDTVTYAVLTPSFISINSTTGEISWIPNSSDPSQLGNIPVTIQVSEGNLATLQSFNIKVEVNDGPTLQPIPTLAATAGALLQYQLDAIDPEGDQLTYDPPTGAPTGFSINAFGRIIFTPTPALVGQNYTIGITVRDPYGASATRSFNLGVVGDTQGPTVELAIDQNPIQPGQTARFYVDATDNVGVTSKSVTVTGVGTFPIGADGYVDVPIATAGTYAVSATAIDTSGNAATPATDTLSVLVDNSDPVAVISSVGGTGGEEITVTQLATIAGSASDPDGNFATYSLTLESVETGEVFSLAAGTTAVTGTPPASWQVDPTGVRNGRYVLKLDVYDRFSKHASDSVELNIEGEAKVGNYRFAETDVTIPIFGVPLSLSRSYDTLNHDRFKDFGYGWQMHLDMHLQESEGVRSSYSLDPIDAGLYGYSYSPNNPGSVSVRVGGARDVWITLPDGERVRFVFEIDASTNRAKFTAPANVHATLTIPDGLDQLNTIDLGANDFTYWQAGGPPTFGEFFNGPAPIDKFDIPAYVLTLEDGTQFRFEKNEDDATADFADGRFFDNNFEPNDSSYGFVRHAYSGEAKLTKITDPEGNWIDIQDGQLIARSPANAVVAGLTLTRDPVTGRIVSVTDATGQVVVEYDYDDLGDLTGVTRLISTNPLKKVTTQYNYQHLNGTSTHKLTSVSSPSGKTPILNEYDPATGRLIATIDAFGRRIEYGHDFAARRESVTDRRGQVTVFDYNQFGDVVQMIDPNGLKSIYDYDDNQGGIGDVPGPTEGSTRNLLSQTSTAQNASLAFAKSYTYDPKGFKTSETFTVDGNTFTTQWAYIDNTRGEHVLDYSIAPDGTKTQNTYYTTGANSGRLQQVERLAVNGELLERSVNDEYDGAGRLTRSTQWNNNTGSWQPYVVNIKVYNSAGYLEETRQQKPGGDTEPFWLRKTTFSYDGNGNQLTSTQWKKQGPNWLAYATTTNEYDRLNRVVKTTDALNRVTQTVYNDDGQVLDSIDAHGIVTRNDYDGLGQLKSTTHAFGRPSDASTTSTVYTAGLVTRTVDKFNQATDYKFDKVGRLVQTLYPDGTSTETVYDEAGRVQYVTDRHVANTPANATETVYNNAGQGRFTKRRSGVLVNVAITLNGQNDEIAQPTIANAGTVFSSAETIYDAKGRVGQTIGVDGQPTTNNYNANTGRLDSVTDALNHTTQYQYDGVGRQIRIIDALSHQTTTDYDEVGQVAKVTYHDNSYMKTGYDDLGRKVSETKQLAAGSTSQQEIDSTTNYEYDVVGNLRAVVQPAVTLDYSGTTQTIRPRYEYEYNAFGEMSIQRDAMDSSFVNSGQDRETRFSYDDLGRRIARILPGDSTGETNSYDTLGRMKLHVDFKGQVTDYVYDDSPLIPLAERKNLGRLVEIRYFSTIAAYNNGAGTPSEKTHTTYDTLGREQTVTEHAGSGLPVIRTTTYSYDADNRLTSAATPEGTLSYQYDVATGRHLRTYTTTNSTVYNDTVYTYDELGRLKQVLVAKLNGNQYAAYASHSSFGTTASFSSGTPQQTSYAYDLVGSLDTVTYHNGAGTTDDVVHNYDYDALNRLDLETVTRGGSTQLARYDYFLFANGQRDYVLETDAAGVVTKIDWAYDALDRLTQETYDKSNNGQDGSDFVANYQLDLTGNRLAKVTDKVGAAGDEMIAYVYNAKDQLTSENSSLSGVTSYRYDPNGSTTEVAGNGQTRRYLWDLRNRLVGFDGNGDDLSIAATGVSSGVVNDSADATFGYDHEGTRVSRSTPGGSATVFLQDENNPTGYSQVIEEKPTSTSAPTRSYAVGSDIIAQADGSTLRHLLYDGGGSTRALLDATGQIAAGEVYAYDAFGNRLDATNPASPATSLLYRGEYSENLLGQYVLRARHYDPRLGRFNSFDRFHADPSSPVDLHKYLYCRSEPVNAIDPTGQYTLLEVTFAVAIIAVLVGIGAVAYSKVSGAAKLTRLQSDVKQAVVAMSSMNSMDRPNPALLPPFNATIDVGDTVFGAASATSPGFTSPVGTLVGGPGNDRPLRAGAYSLPYSGDSMIPQPYIAFIAKNNDDAPVLVYNRGAFEELQRRKFLGKERQTNDMSKIAIFVQEGWKGTSAGITRSHWIAKFAGPDSGITLDHRYNINIDVQSMWQSTGGGWRNVTFINGSKPADLNGAPY